MRKILFSLRSIEIPLPVVLAAFALNLAAQEPGEIGKTALKTTVPVGTVTEKENMESGNYTGVVLSPQIVRIVPGFQGNCWKSVSEMGTGSKKGRCSTGSMISNIRRPSEMRKHRWRSAKPRSAIPEKL